MIDRPRAERTTQNRVVGLFTDPGQTNGLGYRYLPLIHKGRAFEDFAVSAS